MQVIQTELKNVKPGDCCRIQGELFMRIGTTVDIPGKVSVVNLKGGKILVGDAIELVVPINAVAAAEAVVSLMLRPKEMLQPESAVESLQSSEPEPWAVTATRITPRESTSTPACEMMAVIGLITTTFIVVAGLLFTIIMLGLGLAALVEGVL